MRDGGGARGEFDLTIGTETTLMFIEVKAKPMLALPLMAEVDSPRGRAASTPGRRFRWQRFNTYTSSWEQSTTSWL